MKISAAQAEALGGCKECEPAGTVKVDSGTSGPPSVVVVDPSKPDWVGIALVTPDGKPVAGEPFAVELPDGRKVFGKLDNLGKARIEGVEPGSCKVTFPDRDATEWKPR